MNRAKPELQPVEVDHWPIQRPCICASDTHNSSSVEESMKKEATWRTEQAARSLRWAQEFASRPCRFHKVPWCLETRCCGRHPMEDMDCHHSGRPGLGYQSRESKCCHVCVK